MRECWDTLEGGLSSRSTQLIAWPSDGGDGRGALLVGTLVEVYWQVDGLGGGGSGHGEGVEGPHIASVGTVGGGGGAFGGGGCCSREWFWGRDMLMVMGGGSGGQGDQRAEGQAQGQHGVGGLMGDPQGLGEAERA
ncbi:hypothetical protein CYMTET_4067 [Cymbomonas tetramitiformis]|uniref:Uncharacterized protein n=1 Tax=Cymbomonas tetramitiformis TaxID=36881 RepID=A0AAE0LKF2_9CHLO|nr:hypothetical protein CYMTET_4067 [Cymbomonas tetramitiformis]